MIMKTERPYGTEEDLLRDLEFALRNIPELRPKPRYSEYDPRRTVAQKVLEHLKLSNWLFEKGPPTRNH